jgi:photosystem II stability/assembly factor-like uncharacterized protein
MKKYITLLILLPLSLNAQWEILNEGFKGSINTIDFVDEYIGWIAGSNGTLLKTNDGGENWDTVPIDENWDITQIDFINESVGWAIGSMCNSLACYGIIIKTNDGGFNWTMQKQILEIIFTSIYVIDEYNVCVLDYNKIYKTTNGGTNWIDISPNLVNRNYQSLWFQNPNTGVVVGSYLVGTVDKGTIIKTTDGGISWNEKIVSQFNSIFDLQFLNDSIGYFKAYKDTSNFICKTEDIFSSWTIKTTHPYGINSYQFINNNLAYAIMADSITNKNIMKSIDGGVSWQNVQSFNFFGDLTKIYFCQESVGFMYGNFLGGRGLSIIYKSENNNSWSIQKFSLNLNDIYSFDKDRGIIIGRSSYGHGGSISSIFFTMDGGNTWNITYSNGGMFLSCIFLNEMEGFSLDSWRGIYKTSDFGINWNIVYENNFDSTGFDFRGNDICFMDENTGWAVGNYSVTDTSGAGILGTLDGGESWDLVKKFPNEGQLFSICFADTTAWAVDDGGMIVKYTSQTGWVKQTSVTDLPLNKVFFLDDNYGWITGGYQYENDFHPILLKTTNSGANWNTFSNVPYLIKDIAFIDNNRGWAIGYTVTGEGGILETIDGGITWNIDTGNLSSKLNSLFIKDNYGWAVGDNGLILRTIDAGAVWVEDENANSLPTEFVLEQNYPNPFNPVTKIRYSIPSVTLSQSKSDVHVTLKVYDVLGREVATLVNKEQPAGGYEVEFNPVSSIQHLPAGRQGLVSGVYFYRLTADSYTSTKKMLLLK